jgi:hypothetical protein
MEIALQLVVLLLKLPRAAFCAALSLTGIVDLLQHAGLNGLETLGGDVQLGAERSVTRRDRSLKFGGLAILLLATTSSWRADSTRMAVSCS